MYTLDKIDLPSYDKIIIIGYPKSGKTTLFDKLTHEGLLEHARFHTDDYMKYEFRQALYTMMDDIKPHSKWIVEGVQGFRLLRKITQLGLDKMKPDLIIHCSTDKNNFSKHASMRKSLDKIWIDYIHLEKNIPERLQVKW